MIKYLKSSYKKLKDDALAKALYDILKYLTVIILTYLVLKLVPQDTTFGSLLSKNITINTLLFGLIILLVITFTVIVLFLFNKKRFAIIKQDLHTDEMTGIPNHRALSEDLDKTIEWAKSENKTFSIILMDIDDFKNFNTKYDLSIADEVLMKFGTLLKSDNRITDKIYRQHTKGDEFIIITKETILENAVKAADRKRENIAKTSIQISGNHVPVLLSVCCGVVEFNPKTDNQKTILDRAFDAMKSAKSKSGKNATVSYI